MTDRRQGRASKTVRAKAGASARAAGVVDFTKQRPISPFLEAMPLGSINQAPGGGQRGYLGDSVSCFRSGI